MGVSIYYSASRAQPLTVEERLAIDSAVARFPVEELLSRWFIAEDEFDGGSFSVYRAGEWTEPEVVFEGATRLPLCSEDAFWAAVQYWCRLLSEIRRGLPGATWRVHVDDADIPWDEGSKAFDPYV